MSIVQITENISYLPASEKPLSCDVVFIKTNKATWIFDVGLCKEAAREINKIQGPKNVVVSHFHVDHILNLPRVKYDKLYVSAYSKRYSLKGCVISQPTEFDEEPKIRIMELPSSHAKGCLCLICGDYAFMGDGTYCKPVKGHHSYNVQKLQQMIECLKTIDAPYFCLSHDEKFIKDKEAVIKLYEEIYSQRDPNNPRIDVESYFKEDGKPKKKEE